MNFPQENPYESTYGNSFAVAQADQWERSVFLRRTYSHLAAAIAAFVAIEYVIFSVAGEAVGNLVRGMTTGYNWLIVLGAFMVVSWVANKWAVSATSLATQYFGLSLYVVAQAVIFLPLLFVANRIGEGTITAAALLTGIVFGGLTLFVFVTKADFSGLGKYLALASLVAMGVIVVGIVTQADIFGLAFSGCLVALACGYILYDTSNVLHHYRTDQYVAAALALFASVAILFWYILRIVIALTGRD